MPGYDGAVDQSGGLAWERNFYGSWAAIDHPCLCPTKCLTKGGNKLCLQSCGHVILAWH